MKENPLLTLFQGLTDPRRGQAQQYPMAHIFVRVLLCMLGGALTAKQICMFMQRHFDVFEEMFPSKMKRAPAQSTLGRIIRLALAQEVEGRFRRLANLLNLAMGGGEGEVVASDGKKMLGSYDSAEGKDAIQVLRMIATSSGLVLAHAPVQEKSNEIPALRELMAQLEGVIDLRDFTCTADALHDNQQTLDAIVLAGGNALIQVKGNQPKLLEKLEEIASRQAPVETVTNKDTKPVRNRVESRQVDVFEAGPALELPRWDKIAPVAVRVGSTVHHYNHETPHIWDKAQDTRWFVSTSFSRCAMLYAYGVRMHWHSENKVHHVLDVTMEEDKSRIRKAPLVFTTMRSFALNVLRFNKKTNIREALYENGLYFSKERIKILIDKVCELLALPAPA
jgi:predicted transposase YbfD/YdcC